ncbi:MAG: DUF1284 domain-containing protein [Romboutsia sp.]
MLKIRPHHILCMRTYQGNGYSKEFNDNMEKVIKHIKVYNDFCGNKNLESKNTCESVEIVFSLDCICSKCTNNINKNLCSSQNKVNELDKKVSEYFGIKEGIYNYRYLENIVYNNITEDIFDDICENCEWYNIANCKQFIL